MSALTSKRMRVLSLFERHCDRLQIGPHADELQPMNGYVRSRITRCNSLWDLHSLSAAAGALVGDVARFAGVRR